MTAPANTQALVAVDLGAQSCRVSLLRWNKEQPEITVVHRFANEPIATPEGLRWKIGAIFAGVTDGLRSCAQRASEGIASIAIDGWAVDYVRLNERGEAVADPYCYRDTRTELSESAVHARISSASLYRLTGIQILRINTLYQLYADKLAGVPESPWLNIPEYLTYKLCGRRVSEYTNATHTGLVELGKQSWCDSIFDELGLDSRAAPEIVPSGTVLGRLGGELAKLPAFRTTSVIAAACHDTAAAIAGIPAQGDDWAFISSGTWSLVGTVLDSPCVSPGAQTSNFTNLGAAGGRYGFLKNVNGMWLLRQCMDEWEEHGFRWTVRQLVERSAALPPPSALIDVDAPELLTPGGALSKINAQLQRSGAKPFQVADSDLPELSNTIFHSLAARYQSVLSAIETITGKRLRRLYIVGGGGQNLWLNRLTAERTGLEVIPGAVESTTIGNFAIQLAALEAQGSRHKGADAEAIARWAQSLAQAGLAQNDRTTD